MRRELGKVVIFSSFPQSGGTESSISFMVIRKNLVSAYKRKDPFWVLSFSENTINLTRMYKTKWNIWFVKCES